LHDYLTGIVKESANLTYGNEEIVDAENLTDLLNKSDKFGHIIQTLGNKLPNEVAQFAALNGIFNPEVFNNQERLETQAKQVVENLIDII
jgi:hypothetical protein